jgi:Berberine and berberine like
MTIQQRVAALPQSVRGRVLRAGDDDSNDRVKAAYGPNYVRLRQIKASYDLTNLFRFDHNIARLTEVSGYDFD